MNESEIFLAAAQIEDPAIRSAFLESVCQGDISKRQKIEKLLAQYNQWQGAIDVFSDQASNEKLSLLKANKEKTKVGESLTLAEGAKAGKVGEWLAGTKVGNYEIIQCLGVGGMGEVYLAFDNRLNRNVALKFLPSKRSSNTTWVRRFENEARAASGLNHPNILTIYEIGRFSDSHFIASEYVSGDSLRALMTKSLDLRQKIDIVLQIAEALNAAHSAAIIHRDIKPENVMVRHDGLVKVLDFGIAKYLSGNSNDGTLRPSMDTNPRLIMGTVRYMAPEQAKRLDIDARADIYSLGLVLYELLTGDSPFEGMDDTAVLLMHVANNPLKLVWKNVNVASSLQQIINKMVQADRESRFSSAEQVITVLKRFAEQLQGHHPTHDAPTLIQTHDSLTHDSAFEAPPVRYARSEQVNIAYQILGSGDIDIVFVMGWVSHLDWFWKEPGFARFLSRLASFARLIIFDKRGTGLSDRVPYSELPTLEQRMDDVRAVMEAAGSERAILCGVSEGGPMCTLFAATYPEKTIALVMMGSYARRLRAEDYPWGPTEEQREVFFEEIRRNWGGPVGIDTRAPSRANDPEFRNWWATYLRMGASPGAALALTQMNAQIDIRHILKAVQVPTLVLHRVDDKCLVVDEGRYLATNIPGAKFVQLPGEDHLPFVGNQEDFLEPIEEFLTGVAHNQNINRILATVLFAKVARDSRPRTIEDPKLLGLSQSHFVREVELFRGRTVDREHGQMTATFDGPARAIRAAIGIRDSAIRLGIDLQIGLHTGECDISPERTSGPGVELAKVIADFGGPNQVLVSSTVKDLVAGSGIQFADQGTVRLSADLTACNLFTVESN
jgi:serine/threonine protein kinase/class 3 adenylate cyclase